MIHYFIISLLVLIIIVLISAMSSRDKLYNLLVSIYKQNKTIIMNQQELADQLNAIGTQLDKTKNEILAEVANLETQIQNSGNVTPEVQAALAGVKSKVQGLDDLNPDAPQQPSEPPAGTQG